MSALPQRRYTEAEYLALEEKAEDKSQYMAGEIFSMASAEPVHARIATNIASSLTASFRGRSGEAFNSDLRVRGHEGSMWTYPDVTALSGEPRYDATGKPASLLNPQVIFEVLSPSTEAFDRGSKFARYRSIESLQDYILVSTELCRVEHFERTPEGSWLLSIYEEQTDRLPLRSVACEVPLADIYEKVTFPEAAT